MSSNHLPHPFAGQYFVVTGSTQGLGAAVARMLATRGAAGVILCGRSPEKGELRVAELAELGCQAHFVRADLESVADCREVIRIAEANFGTLHGLVNCAGMSDRGSILDTTPELFDSIFATNIRAPFFLMQEAIRLMIRQDVEGNIVNIVTMSAYGGTPGLSPYAASKAALATLTRNTAYALLRNRIRVNGLNIGWMDTPHEHEIQQQYHGAGHDWLREQERDQPFGRLLKPEEVARAVGFLMSGESGMMTGALIDFDQGVIGCSEFDSSPRPSRAMHL